MSPQRILRVGALPLLFLVVLPTGGCGRESSAPATRRDMLDAATEIAREAGALIMRHYDRAATEGIEVETKADRSPVTQADREANALIVMRLGELDPGTPVVAEESDLPPYEDRRGWTRFWLVDPVDGTKEFIKRNGEFTVNIALVEDGEPVVGVIYAPAFDLVYRATKGEGAWKIEGGDKPQRLTSGPPAPELPLKVLMSRSHAEGTDLATLLPGRTIDRVIPSGSALKFGLLAEGVGDVYVRNVGTSEWDVAAGDCIYRNSAEAGYRSTPFTYNKPDVTNPGFVLGLEP